MGTESARPLSFRHFLHFMKWWSNIIFSFFQSQVRYEDAFNSLEQTAEKVYQFILGPLDDGDPGDTGSKEDQAHASRVPPEVRSWIRHNAEDNAWNKSVDDQSAGKISPHGGSASISDSQPPAPEELSSGALWKNANTDANRENRKGFVQVPGGKSGVSVSPLEKWKKTLSEGEIGAINDVCAEFFELVAGYDVTSGAASSGGSDTGITS